MIAFIAFWGTPTQFVQMVVYSWYDNWRAKLPDRCGITDVYRCTLGCAVMTERCPHRSGFNGAFEPCVASLRPCTRRRGHKPHAKHSWVL